MSASWKSKSNRTPFTDVCGLVKVATTEDADGYETNTESKRDVFCSVAAGVVRAEFYEAYKAGIELSMTVELWEDDYEADTLLDHDGKRYRIVRAYPTGHGTLQLTCAEVKR